MKCPSTLCIGLLICTLFIFLRWNTAFTRGWTVELNAIYCMSLLQSGLQKFMISISRILTNPYPPTPHLPPSTITSTQTPKTGAETAQTHGPMNPKLCLLLTQTVAKFCQHVFSSLLSLLSLLSIMSHLSRCQIYFHTALLQLQTIAEIFDLVWKFETMCQWPKSRI